MLYIFSMTCLGTACTYDTDEWMQNYVQLVQTWYKEACARDNSFKYRAAAESAQRRDW